MFACLLAWIYSFIITATRNWLGGSHNIISSARLQFDTVVIDFVCVQSPPLHFTSILTQQSAKHLASHTKWCTRNLSIFLHCAVLLCKAHHTATTHHTHAKAHTSRTLEINKYITLLITPCNCSLHALFINIRSNARLIGVCVLRSGLGFVNLRVRSY